MADINPDNAAALANGIYAAQSERGALVFLEQPLFLKKQEILNTSKPK